MREQVQESNNALADTASVDATLMPCAEHDYPRAKVTRIGGGGGGGGVWGWGVLYIEGVWGFLVLMVRAHDHAAGNAAVTFQSMANQVLVGQVVEYCLPKMGAGEGVWGVQNLRKEGIWRPKSSKLVMRATHFQISCRL